GRRPCRCPDPALTQSSKEIHVPEAVIVAAHRSPIGRARKGSLKDVRPDELASQMVRATLDQVPQLDPSTIDDLQLGAGLPEGYQGGNLARVVATRLGMDTVPGATVTRFCAASIETTRTAFHAIRSGEARAVISAGVESLSFGTGRLVEDDARDPQFSPPGSAPPGAPPARSPRPGTTRARTTSCPTPTS